MALISCLAFGKAETPAVVVNHDGNVIRIIESLGAALEGRVVEMPFRGCDLPDQPRKFPPVLVIAFLATLGREIELIPPLKLRLRQQRHLAGLLAANEIAAHRDHRLAALGPQRRDY